MFDIEIFNIHQGFHQMDHLYSNIEYPCVRWSAGRLIFECLISICEAVRWTLDIQISNMHLGGGQMDV